MIFVIIGIASAIIVLLFAIFNILIHKRQDSHIEILKYLPRVKKTAPTSTIRYLKPKNTCTDSEIRESAAESLGIAETEVQRVQKRTKEQSPTQRHRITEPMTERSSPPR